jgi:hypothetical protein
MPPGPLDHIRLVFLPEPLLSGAEEGGQQNEAIPLEANLGEPDLGSPDVTVDPVQAIARRQVLELPAQGSRLRAHSLQLGGQLLLLPAETVHLGRVPGPPLTGLLRG